MKKVLKRVLVIVLCISVFCFPMTFSFATTSSLLPANVVTWDDVSADGKALAEAYVNLVQSGSNLDIKQMFKSATDIPLSYFKLLSDGSWVLSPVDNIYYYIKDGKFYVHEEGHGGGGGRSRDAVSSSDVYIPSDSLVDYIEEQNTLNTPKGKDLFKQSYWSDKVWRSFDTFYYNYSTNIHLSNNLPLFDDTKKSQLSDLYLVPFYSDENGVQYYSNYQYHLYYIPIEDANADFSLYLDTYSFTDGFGYVLQSPLSGWVADFTANMLPYSISLGQYILGYNPKSQSPYYPTEIYTLSVESYSAGKLVSTYNLFNRGIPSDIAHYYSNDGVDKFLCYQVNSPDLNYFCNSHKNTSVKPSEDLGFICSKSLISREYSIDTSKIPSNQIINITGDTIYDYSITNPDTGASTTINEYVTNNYYYPEVPSTSEPSGGSVGGNVNVGGNINVGGQVDVNIGVSVPDININVNQGSGAGGSGTGINPDDILDGSSVNLDKYYDDAVSQASGVRSFLKQFFDFLPAELVGLICMLVAVAIVCRIFGR